jgi:hypothetical protein
MGGAKKKNLTYKKFTVKQAPKAGASKSQPKADSATRLKLLESKYRSAPIALVPGKSKAVARIVAGKKPGKAVADSTRATPTKKAFFLEGEPIAYQG